jgi:hypothetical protein
VAVVDDNGLGLSNAVAHVLALRPDLESLLRDLKAEGTGRARCFLQALDELADAAPGHDGTATAYSLEEF